ncbi:MAG: SDR family NAD(P)-dependent oxidoreductase [Gammaproteobacteria bacterium]|nr:SDR family NAD(P)-dependent oxidoreductase [Gammaproteobacteria bacterium]
MEDFKEKVAFITGGGSGVALGQAKVFGKAGCKVVIADIREDHLAHGLKELKAQGTESHGIKLDITDREAYARAADEAERVFGPVQLLFNTAGVSIFGPLEQSSYDDYDWQMGVNFGGGVNGIQTFVPRMIAHGKGGHIVNTASLGAFLSSNFAGIYCASKFAVLGLTEALRQALERYNIGVSVLCPANVKTNIAESIKTRPEKFSHSGYLYNEETISSLQRIYSQGMEPVELAQHVLEAVKKNQLYIIPYPEAREPLKAHFESIIASLPPEDSDPEGVAKRQAAMLRYREEVAEQQRQRK